MSECTHERTNANGCMGCPAVFCVGCRKWHRGIPNMGRAGDDLFNYWDRPNPGPCIERIHQENERLRSALRQIQRWDMLNPPYPGVLGDAPWLKKLVDDALGSPSEGSDK